MGSQSIRCVCVFRWGPIDQHDDDDNTHHHHSSINGDGNRNGSDGDDSNMY